MRLPCLAEQFGTLLGEEGILDRRRGRVGRAFLLEDDI